MAKDAVLLLLPFESFSDVNQNRQSRDYGKKGHKLRVAEAAKHRTRIDTDELHQEARQPGPDEVFGNDFALGTRLAQRLASQLPQVDKNHHPGKKFVNRRGMHAVYGWNQAVGKAHAPGQRGGNAIIAIAGDQASNAADGITQRRSRSGNIKHRGH